MELPRAVGACSAEFFCTTGPTARAAARAAAPTRDAAGAGAPDAVDAASASEVAVPDVSDASSVADNANCLNTGNTV